VPSAFTGAGDRTVNKTSKGFCRLTAYCKLTEIGNVTFHTCHRTLPVVSVLVVLDFSFSFLEQGLAL
jgi:hypothetical protein